MTIKSIFQKNKLQDTELLLCHALNKPKEFLFTNPDYNLSQKEKDIFKLAVRKRQSGVPAAYILGYKYFHGLKFKVNRSVLIPRPETETLVDLALSLVKDKGLKIKDVLDLGTGSGCIAVSLYKLLETQGVKKIYISASDVSSKAINVARQNAKSLKAKINFTQSNLFESIEGKFDLILANLPYVPESLYQILRPTLKYEPKIAITDSTDRWDIYGEFFKTFSKHLRPNGVTLMEIDDDSKTELKKLFTQNCKKFQDFKLTFIRDLGGKIRFLKIVKIH